jgi:ABC-type siderophore export system fused ATPase/permease subunit
MVLVDFIRRADRRQIRTMLALTTVAGFANAALVVVVNLVAGHVAQGAHPGLWLWLAFGGAFVLYYLCDRIALLQANAIIERLLRDLRVSVVAKLRRSELPIVEKLGRGQLYNLVAQETNHLSVTFPLMIESFQQAVLMAVSLIYLGYLSLAALAVFAVAVVLGIMGYRHFNANFREQIAQLGRSEARLVDAVGDIIDGSKELRLHTRRSDACARSCSSWCRRCCSASDRSRASWASRQCSCAPTWGSMRSSRCSGNSMSGLASTRTRRVRRPPSFGTSAPSTTADFATAIATATAPPFLWRGLLTCMYREATLCFWWEETAAESRPRCG